MYCEPRLIKLVIVLFVAHVETNQTTLTTYIQTNVIVNTQTWIYCSVDTRNAAFATSLTITQT